MSKKFYLAVLAVCAMFFVAFCGSKIVFAAETGTSGTCPYEIDDGGVLTIGDGTYCELGNNTESDSDFYPWYDNNSVYSIVVKPNVVAASNSSYLFSDLTNASIFDLNNLDTSNVTDMFGMFMSTNNFSIVFNLNLSAWDTRNVTNMSCMFCSTGADAVSFVLNLSGWNTSKVTNMASMFNSAGSFDADTFYLNLTGWDTSNVTSMSSMFNLAGVHANNWIVNGIASWNTGKVTNMHRMFAYVGYGSSHDISFDLSNWDTSKVIDMTEMFVGVPVGELVLGAGTNNLNSSTGLSTTNFLKSVGGDIDGVFTDINNIADEAAFWGEVSTLTNKRTFLGAVGDTNSISLDAGDGVLVPSTTPATVYTLADNVPTAAMIKEAGITATKADYTFADWTVTNTGANTYEALANYVPGVPNTGAVETSQEGATSSILAVLVSMVVISGGCVIIGHKRTKSPILKK